MHISPQVLQQRQKERQRLILFVACGLLGSGAVHAAAMGLKVGQFWTLPLNSASENDQEETEIVVQEFPEEQAPETVTETIALEETPPQTEAELSEEMISQTERSQETAIAPVPPVPLAPTSQALPSPGEDAPSSQPASPTHDPVAPMTNQKGAIPADKSGGGPIQARNGKGHGFGNGNQATGFNTKGRPDGEPNGSLHGKPNGVPNGILNGSPNGNSIGDPKGNPEGTATRPTAPVPQAIPRLGGKPVCVSCPRPKYRGSEGSPRVTYDIAPDGRVINVRLRKSSGNAETDRETLEALSKWRFDPKTVEGGRQNVRVRVTFEESGSSYQQQNQERRRQQRSQPPNNQPNNQPEEQSPQPPFSTTVPPKEGRDRSVDFPRSPDPVPENSATPLVEPTAPTAVPTAAPDVAPDVAPTAPAEIPQVPTEAPPLLPEALPPADPTPPLDAPVIPVEVAPPPPVPAENPAPTSSNP